MRSTVYRLGQNSYGMVCGVRQPNSRQPYWGSRTVDSFTEGTEQSIALLGSRTVDSLTEVAEQSIALLRQPNSG